MPTMPKSREALQAALRAPDHTLTRCCGGFFDASKAGTPHARATIVTRRTANDLHNAMLAEFNDRDVPSALTLTARGVAEARALAGAA